MGVFPVSLWNTEPAWSFPALGLREPLPGLPTAALWGRRKGCWRAAALGREQLHSWEGITWNTICLEFPS